MKHLVAIFVAVIVGAVAEVSAQSWTLTADSLQGLSATSKCSLALLQEQFPDTDVTALVTENETGEYVYYTIEKDNKKILEIIPEPTSSTIYSATIFSTEPFEDPPGHIGDLLPDLIPDEVKNEWVFLPGIEELSGMVLAVKPEEPHLYYIFKPIGHEGPDGELPPKEALDNSILIRLVLSFSG